MVKTRTARVLTLIVVSLSLLLLPLISGCSKRPSKDELSKLEQVKKAALAAEKDLEAKKAEVAKLEKELNEKQKELNELKAARDEVKDCVAAKKAKQ
jgi:peptidoglycan hydrolase CwlO-like protein